MNVGELLPNINVTESARLDRRSIQFLRNILPDDLVDCEQLQTGGTLPNIDGYLDILCPDGTAREKIVVQVKHLTYPEIDGDVYYDIPQSIYAYAERHKGEVVIFITCDDVNKKFYWRYIDAASIEEFKNKSKQRIQNTARYHFHEKEKCSYINVRDTIKFWRELYNKKMESIKDEKVLAEQFSSQQRMCFNSISSELHGVKNSHIVRYQVNEIMQWIKADGKNKKPICLLIGDAGVGKSAVLKDLISLYQSKDIRYLCIKADYIDDNGNPVTLEKIRDTLAYYSTEANKVILIIDQIDALSQSLTNDRKHLNMMMTVLSSLEDWSNVTAIVSCRKYDLEYDSVLNSLKNKSTHIEIGELTDEEVMLALNNLEEGLGKRVDSVTAKVLKTVQMLNSFSILFHRNKTKINFNSQIELYDALWNDIVCGASLLEEVSERECLMYKIAETIRVEGTLNPQFIPVTSQKRAYEYLASNGLIRRSGCTVSFFHQSFYEYTLARHYTEKGDLFAMDIKKEIQGLEIRSTVKAVLDFKRGHDVMMFVEEARSILNDSDIRLHLKLLTLSVLAFVDKPIRGEKKIISDICQEDKRMLTYFLRGVSSPNWFPTIRKMLCGIMLGLRKSDESFFSIILCLSRYAFNNPEKVYDMVNEIENQDARLYAIAYILRRHNDYSKPCVLEAFAETKLHNTVFFVDLILDAIKSNRNFALDETEKLIKEYLTSDESCRDRDGYELVDELCTKLCAEYPMEMLGILHRCICKTVRVKARKFMYIFSTTRIFNMVDADSYVGKLLKMYEDLLARYSSNETIVHPLVLELLSLNDEITLSMAFNTMTMVPKIFDNEIRSLLEDSNIIEGYLQGDVEFFFLNMLKSWYNTLDENDMDWYQRFLLSYKSELDFNYASKRTQGFLCFYLWRNKWKLICNTLPDKFLIPEMKKCFQELMRRFGNKIEVERPDHSVITYCCGGIVSYEIYAKWSISNWFNSFLKLSEDECYKGRHPISFREHAENFKKCVSSDPGKFYDFIMNISTRTDIPDIYVIAGFEGLLIGGVDPYTLWSLAEQYFTENFAKNNGYTFQHIAEYYIKEENMYINKIMSLCKRLVVLPLDSNNHQLVGDDGDRDLNRRANDLLTRGLNSFQGHAAELMVHMCAIKSRRPMIYKFFMDNSLLLHECVKTVLLYYMNFKDYYDEELYFSMLKSFLSNMGPEALYIRVKVIQWCFYNKIDVVINYINSIESDFLCHELLAQIYFYGMVKTNRSKECERRLEKILAFDSEKVVAKIVEVAMKSYKYNEYRQVSIRYLERFVIDKREKVINAYCFYCDSLPVEAFPWFYNIAMKLFGKKYREIHSQLGYVKKCISVYPTLCYRFISSQKYWEIEDAQIIENDIVKILLEIYKKLSQDEDTEAMNEVLDLFDEYIYHNNGIIKGAISLLV